jgi:hypothetical protein
VQDIDLPAAAEAVQVRDAALGQQDGQRRDLLVVRWATSEEVPDSAASDAGLCP